MDELIRPCECRGEFAYAHRVCLSNWIETTRHEYCDICRLKYDIAVYDRSIFDWIFETQQIEKTLRVSCIALLVYYLGALGILIPKCNSSLYIAVKASAYIWIVMCTICMAIYWYLELLAFLSWRKENKKIVVNENKHPQLESKIRPKDVLKSSGFRPHDKDFFNEG